jgi:hypothetical protein
MKEGAQLQLERLPSLRTNMLCYTLQCVHHAVDVLHVIHTKHLCVSGSIDVPRDNARDEGSKRCNTAHSTATPCVTNSLGSARPMTRAMTHIILHPHTLYRTPATSAAPSCYAMLSYAMLRYAMLCYAMLCYAMLCYAMLCYAMRMLCCAMQDARHFGRAVVGANGAMHAEGKLNSQSPESRSRAC